MPVNGVIEEIYMPNKVYLKHAHVNSLAEYERMYKKSIEDPETFWAAQAKEFYWKSPPLGDFLRYNFDIFKGPVFIRWMEGATTNICYNCLDRNVNRGLGDQVAYYWEGNDPDDHFSITYAELLKEVCKFANVLKNKGVKKGDCVAFYMPMVVELVVGMLACARLGAVHSVVFGGYSAGALAERIMDCKCFILVCADGVWRGSKLLNIKEAADRAIEICRTKGHKLDSNIVVRHLGSPQNDQTNGNTVIQPCKRPAYDLQTAWNPEVDTWWHEEMASAEDVCEPEWVDAEDPLFMLFTSGSTGKPKGIVHTTGGYLLYTAATFKFVFDYHLGDVYFCTADIGWITGHSYVIYGPLLNGARSVLFEGLPTYPDPGRYWAIVEKYSVSKFYTAPTAIRAMMKYGDGHVKKYNRSTLRVLGSVGEPINPEVWLWYYRVVGEGRCAIVDTFWQSETGGHVITSLPGCTPMKPGSSTLPFFGVQPALVDESGKEILDTPGEGYLVFKRPWPGIMRTMNDSHERFERTYFTKFPGYYCTGDGARRDSSGYYWITGRTDDMLNVSGHLLSTSEVESALVEHKAVAESAVVSHPHPLKGECLYCFVVLKEGYSYTDSLEADLKRKVRTKIGPFATPEYIHPSSSLPKTRSGKILRRVLRKIASNDRDVGDLSTLTEECVIDDLFRTRPMVITA